MARKEQAAFHLSASRLLPHLHFEGQKLTAPQPHTTNRRASATTVGHVLKTTQPGKRISANSKTLLYHTVM